MRTGPLVIVGDSMLDVDLDGSSERLCPDTPAPVLDLQTRRVRPGGAGLAALLAARAGIPVQLITGVGRDEAADQLLDALHGVEVLPQPLHGSTVIKTRVRLGATTLVRVDSGTGTSAGGPLSGDAATAVCQAGAVLVSDYGRGMAWQPELRELLTLRAAEVPLVWDPHPRGVRPVPGARLATPNRDEAQKVIGAAAPEQARGRELCRLWQSAAVAITTGERGALLTTDGVTQEIPVPEPQRDLSGAPIDTCGAGDRFAVAAAEALRRGHPVLEAVEQAVAAASLFVRTGAAGAHSQLRPVHGPLTPIASPAGDAWTMINRTRRAGGQIVATGGCFDLLHRGHVSLLDRARGLGDLLVVCLNSDASVRRAKGPGRPVVSEGDRATVLASLSSVDAVVIFDDDDPANLLTKLRPDVWVKGDDYAGSELPEAEAVTGYGGRIVLLPVLDGYSTTRLVNASQPVPA